MFRMSDTLIGLAAASFLCAAWMAAPGPAVAEPATVARTPGKLLVQTSRLDIVAWESSALAATRAVRPDVRRYARQVMASHRSSGRELARWAAREGVVLPAAPGNPGGRVSLGGLAAADPGAFDLLYVEFQLRAHVDLINLYSTYWTEGRIPGLRDFSKRKLRVEHEHYRQAIRLRERIRGLGAMVVAAR
jgi:predicted outer membrane protein